MTASPQPPAMAIAVAGPTAWPIAPASAKPTPCQAMWPPELTVIVRAKSLRGGGVAHAGIEPEHVQAAGAGRDEQRHRYRNRRIDREHQVGDEPGEGGRPDQSPLPGAR